jgi:EAL domain-containing protein (putative c-di-GMP-specific phosphodiesterase class I)
MFPQPSNPAAAPRTGSPGKMSAQDSPDQAMDAAELNDARRRSSDRDLPGRSLHFARELGLGLARGEFFVAFEPEMDLVTNRIVGVSAQARWRHPRRGVLQPQQFMPVAELSGLVVPLGNWVMRMAFLDAMRWRGSALGGARVTIKVSPLQLGNDDFIDNITSALRHTGFPAERLVIELPENVIARPDDARFTRLESLHKRGIGLAIGDFGTGYSRLANLWQLPATVLKIHHSFLGAIPGDARNEAIVRTIVELGQTLRLRLVAEGVERQGQADFLRQASCDAAMGSLYAGPMTGAMLAEWAADRAMESAAPGRGNRRPGA